MTRNKIDSQRLNAIKARMTKQQRAQMADLLAKELQNRKQASKPSSAYNASHYQQAIVPSKSAQSNATDQTSNSIFASKKRNALILAGLLAFAFGKVIFSSGVVDATVDRKEAAEKALDKMDSSQHNLVAQQWSSTEKELLTKLDERRVELSKREKSIEERERELQELESHFALRMAELKLITERVAAIRQDRDHRQEARMEQLAQVYGSMAPKEAAPLIARLDESIALALLERMPGKRMGQILSMMESDRAVKLTQLLSVRKSG